MSRARPSKPLVHPVFFGSAITGAGVGALMAGIAELLPAAAGDVDGPVSGTVFKVDRGASGERIAYVRMFSGTIRIRDRLDKRRKVTAIRVFDHGAAVKCGSISARQIGQLWGLGDVQIGEVIGTPPERSSMQHHFAPPTLETVVDPVRAGDRGAMRVALDQLAEQDPLINVRQDDTRQEISVSLYGEVQKEVIQATLADDFGVEVTFRDTTTICIERPLGTGAALELLQSEAHPFSATIGLRIEPAAPESGVQFRLDVDPRDVPVFIYKTRDRFVEVMTQHIRNTLHEGLFGWQVTDCVVTMTDCGYYIGDGPAKPVSPTPRTTAGHFRKLTPLVMMRALERARTVVCEPILRMEIEFPTDAVGAVLGRGVTARPRGRDAVAEGESLGARGVVAGGAGARPSAEVARPDGRRGRHRHELRRLRPGARCATEAAPIDDQRAMTIWRDASTRTSARRRALRGSSGSLSTSSARRSSSSSRSVT